MTSAHSATPLMVPPSPKHTAPWALARRVTLNPEGTLIARKATLGRSWRDMSARSFYDHVRQVAAGLVSRGLQPGDRIAIMAHTSYEWTLCDFAGWEAGLVVVPVYETSSPEQVQWILTDSQVKLIVVENDTMAAMLELLAAQVPELAHVQVLNLEQEALTELIAEGKDVDHAVLDERTAAMSSDDLATVVYTSGTTGRPKGVMLTHGNLIHLALNAVVCEYEVFEGEDVRTLIFLPLAHVLGRFAQLTIVCTRDGVMAHAPNVKNLVTDLATFRPTFVVAVPRVFEKIYNAADALATGVQQKVFRLGAKTAIAYSRAVDTPEGPSRQLRAQRAMFDRVVYSKLRTIMGGCVRHVISGGGPLGERLAHFYRGAGVIMLEGYGLTECAAPATGNREHANQIGTVGQPMPGTAVRIAADGEVEVSGIGLFAGYLNNEQATDAVVYTDEDGTRWLRTGDVGTVGPEGYLTITGRKKELIVTAGGKNVAPAPLEDRLRGHPLVSQVVVVGDDRPCIGALITLDAEMLPLWLRSHRLPDMDVVEASTNVHVLAALDKAIARANESVSRAESIRTFTVLATDFTEANGLLTPSLKVRRDQVLTRFSEDIDALYTKVRQPR